MGKRFSPNTLLLLTTVLFSSAWYSIGAYAAPTSNATHKKKVTSLPSSTTASHPTAAHFRRKPHAVSGGHESLSVTGRHISHGAKVVISRSVIDQLPPGTNPMAALNTAPGVNFQAADPTGIATWTTQIFMHGFDQREIGMTLDGMPLGEMTYRNYNGVNPNLAISSENVNGIDMSQSAGAEDVASTNNLGGSLAYSSINPGHDLGGSVQQGFGSYGSYHTYLRFNSGDLNSTGTRFYTSYMRNDQQRWRGYGNQFNQQVDAKFLQPVGQNSSISAYFAWSDLHEFEYQDTSPDIIDHLGYKVDDYYNGKASGYLAAYQAAQKHYPAGYSQLHDPGDASYYDGATNQSDYLGYLKADLSLTDRLRWTTTAYGHSEVQQTTWTSPGFTSPNGASLSEFAKEPSIRRFGILSQAFYDIAHNHIGGGVWYENNSYNSAMNAYEMPLVSNGVIQGGVVNPLSRHYNDPFAQLFNQNYNTNTFTAFFQDTYRPVRNLSLHFGFKSLLSTTRVGGGYLNAGYYGSDAGTITSGEGLTVAKPFLPHINIDWNFLKHHELFIDISENARTYAQSGFRLSNSPFAVTQADFNAARSTIKPETDWTYAIGYRYNDELLSASVYAYRTNFFNRLQQITSGSLLNPDSSVANVGSVTMNGVDALLTIRPVKHLSITNSISYNHAVYDNNMSDSNGTYNTKNKQVVNYPRFMYKARLNYDWRQFSFYIDGNYVGQRNYDYEGQLRVPGYWLSNLGLQWHVKKISDNRAKLGGFLKGLTVSLNLNNITNQRYIATMGESGNSMTAASAYSTQSMQVGMPRMVFGAIKADF